MARLLARFFGSFKLNFKTADIQNLTTTHTDVNKTVALNAVAKANGDVNLVVVPTNKVIWTLSPVSGSWANVSVMTKLDCALTPTSSTPTSNAWGAFDGVSVPGTTLTKGPIDLFHGRQTTTSLYYSGVTFFVNSKSKSAYLNPLDIDATGMWGTKSNDLPATSGLRRNQATTMVSWAIAANNGTLYVDDILWGFPPQRAVRPTRIPTTPTTTSARKWLSA